VALGRYILIILVVASAMFAGCVLINWLIWEMPLRKQAYVAASYAVAAILSFSAMRGVSALRRPTRRAKS
jgi:hypothetical protein